MKTISRPKNHVLLTSAFVKWTFYAKVSINSKMEAKQAPKIPKNKHRWTEESEEGRGSGFDLDSVVHPARHELVPVQMKIQRKHLHVPLSSQTLPPHSTHYASRPSPDIEGKGEGGRERERGREREGESERVLERDRETGRRTHIASMGLVARE